MAVTDTLIRSHPCVCGEYQLGLSQWSKNKHTSTDFLFGRLIHLNLKSDVHADAATHEVTFCLILSLLVMTLIKQSYLKENPSGHTISNQKPISLL